MGISPSFELQELINENHNWVQTHGNTEFHLRSNYTDILAIDYISDGNTLNVTFRLASGLKNSSAAIFNQPDRISYGMLIDVDSKIIEKNLQELTLGESVRDGLFLQILHRSCI